MIDYVAGDDTTWEQEPLKALVAEGQLAVYHHKGFWQNMDTLRDKHVLEEMWDKGKAPWKVWDRPRPAAQSPRRRPLIRRSRGMRVLLTGADGYIGAIMGPKLIEAGHDVTGLDTGFYRRGWLFDDGRAHPKVVSKDLRDVTVDDLGSFDAVVHLSELSNDPIGENDPGLTMEINHKGSAGLARKAKQAGVKRFVYASSCSTYGAGGDEMRTETSDLAPQTAYAKCKILVEQEVAPMADAAFTPVFMRNATAYGASPRQRFDVVLNNLCGFAHTTGEIRMTSDGSPWRPIVHIDDICQAMLCALDADREAVSGEILQRRRRRRELPHPRDRRDRRPDLPRLRADHRRLRRRHPQLPRLLRQDPRPHAGVPHRLDRRARRPPAPHRLPAHRPHPRDVRGRPLHPPEGAEAPPRHRPARRAPPLARSAGRLTFADA